MEKQYFSVCGVLSNVNCATRETLSSSNQFLIFCRFLRPWKCMGGPMALFYVVNKNTMTCSPYVLTCITNCRT